MPAPHPLSLPTGPFPHMLASLRPTSLLPITFMVPTGSGLGDEDGVDVAVFRFTLGIPGFEDRLIPRFVGAFGAGLVAVNHILSVQPVPETQVRVRARASVCVCVCVCARARARACGRAPAGLVAVNHILSVQHVPGPQVCDCVCNVYVTLCVYAHTLPCACRKSRRGIAQASPQKPQQI